jgi:hypothetical protein
MALTTRQVAAWSSAAVWVTGVALSAQSDPTMSILPESAGLPSVSDWFVMILVGLIWYFEWRLLRRRAVARGFCIWFPTAMLALLVLVLWLDQVVEYGTAVARVLDYAEVLVFGVNLPVLVVAGAAGGLLVEHLPTAAVWSIAGGVFWVSWYLALRLLRWRATLDSPIALHLSR